MFVKILKERASEFSCNVSGLKAESWIVGQLLIKQAFTYTPAGMELTERPYRPKSAVEEGCIKVVLYLILPSRCSFFQQEVE